MQHAALRFDTLTAFVWSVMQASPITQMSRAQADRLDEFLLNPSESVPPLHTAKSTPNAGAPQQPSGTEGGPVQAAAAEQSSEEESDEKTCMLCECDAAPVLND
jgi:hypothetical protein